MKELVSTFVPWTNRYKWKLIALAIVIVAGGGYVYYLNHKVDTLKADLKETQEALVKAKVEYETDMAQFRNTVQLQNDAIGKYNIASTKAKDMIAAANTKAAVTRANTNAQVHNILNQPKPVTCQAAIDYLVNGVHDLKWEQIQ